MSFIRRRKKKNRKAEKEYNEKIVESISQEKGERECLKVQMCAPLTKRNLTKNSTESLRKRRRKNVRINRKLSYLINIFNILGG